MENEILEEVPVEEMLEVEPIIDENVEPVIPTRLVQIRDELHCDFVEYLPEEKLDVTRQIYITDEDRLAIGTTKCFDLINMAVVDYDNTEDLKRQHKEELRAMRVPLLKAFDVYKSSVAYGVEFEGDEQREEILKWYKLLLELDESAFENVPEKIKYYLKG